MRNDRAGPGLDMEVPAFPDTVHPDYLGALNVRRTSSRVTSVPIGMGINVLAGRASMSTLRALPARQFGHSLAVIRG